MCDVADKVNLVLDCTKDRKHNVRTIVLMETPSAELVTRGRQAGIHILSLQEMEVSRQLSTPLFLSLIPHSLFHRFHIQIHCFVPVFIMEISW